MIFRDFETHFIAFLFHRTKIPFPQQQRRQQNEYQSAYCHHINLHHFDGILQILRLVDLVIEDDYFACDRLFCIESSPLIKTKFNVTPHLSLVV